MKVANLLKAKGQDVETVGPDGTTVMALHRLSSRMIGALVVSSDGRRVEGMIAERDVVRGLNKHGARFLELTVGDVMARSVPTCSSEDTLKAVMEKMTRTRHRHLPVVDEGRLAGLVSIGDVVKNLVDDVETQAGVIRDAYLGRQ